MHRVEVRLLGRDTVLLEVRLSGIIRPEEMPDIVMRAMLALYDYFKGDLSGVKVIISGRMPSWLAGSLAYSVARQGGYPMMFDPKIKAAVGPQGETIEIEVVEELKPCRVMVILGGPPKAGKSTIKNKLMSELMYSDIKFYAIEANPDLEGFWASMAALPEWVRPAKKRLLARFSEVVEMIGEQILSLVDEGYAIVVSLGGLPSEENRKLLSEIIPYARERGYKVYLVVLRPFVEKYMSLYDEWVRFAEEIASRYGARLLVAGPEPVSAQEMAAMLSGLILGACEG